MELLKYCNKLFPIGTLISTVTGFAELKEWRAPEDGKFFPCAILVTDTGETRVSSCIDLPLPEGKLA